MKTLITTIISAALCFFFAGCEREMDLDPYNNDQYVRFKVDGVQKEYIPAYGQVGANLYSSTTGIYSTAIAGGKSSSSSTANTVVFAVYTPEPIEEGQTYVDSQVAASFAEYSSQLIFSYTDETGKLYQSLGILAGNYSATADSRLTITELTNEYMTGVFSGTIYASDYTTKVVVTDGEFKLKHYDQNNNTTNNPPLKLDFIEFKADSQLYRLELPAGRGAVVFQTDSSTYSNCVLGLGSLGGMIKNVNLTLGTNSADFEVKNYIKDSISYYPIVDFSCTFKDNSRYDYPRGTSPFNPGNIEITRYETGQGGIIEGTFNFANVDYIDQNGNKTPGSSITEGRFRITR